MTEIDAVSIKTEATVTEELIATTETSNRTHRLKIETINALIITTTTRETIITKMVTIIM